MKVTVNNAFHKSKSRYTVNGITLGRAVFDYVSSHPGTTVKDISNFPEWFSGVSPFTIARTMYRLGARGLLVKREIDSPGPGRLQYAFFANDKFSEIIHRKRKKKLAIKEEEPKVVLPVKPNIDIALMIAIGKNDTLISWDEGRALWEKLETIYGRGK